MIKLRVIDTPHELIVLNWLNTPDVCKYNSHNTFPATEPIKPDKNAIRLGIFKDPLEPYDPLNANFYGVIALQKIDWVNRSAELAVLIGKTNLHRKGIGKKAAELICRHGFDYLNLHRIYCGTHEKNIGMQKVAESVGMVLEGRTRQAFYKHGEYADILHYGVLKEEFHAHFSHIERSGDQPADHPGGGEKAP